MFDTLIWIVYTYIHHSHPREARRNFCIVRLTSFVVFQSILSIHTITPISSARRGENMKLYYVYHTTSYCVHISLHLFSSAQSAEIKCYVLRTTYRILIHVVYHKNIICVAYTGKHNLPIRAERGEKILYIIARGRNIIIGR